MNERIIEMAMEANSQTGNEFDLNHKPLDAFLAKFALLIIQECLLHCYMHGLLLPVGDAAFVKALKGIKKHFGVEQ
jgi:hypothetical protein